MFNAFNTEALNSSPKVLPFGFNLHTNQLHGPVEYHDLPVMSTEDPKGSFACLIFLCLTFKTSTVRSQASCFKRYLLHIHMLSKKSQLVTSPALLHSKTWACDFMHNYFPCCIYFKQQPHTCVKSVANVHKLKIFPS